MAGLAACAPPREQVVPYVNRPEDVVVGKPLFFATAMPLGGYGTGLLVESHEGRPTKVEGNPDHPASLGATDPYAQAAPLSLYDPERSQAVTFQGRIRPWEDFARALAAQLGELRADGGAGLRILTEMVSSPTLADQLARLLAAYPGARWHAWEPLHRDNARAGAVLAFGEVVETRYHFERADVVVALDSDFLACGPGSLRYVRDFTGRRRLYQDAAAMNRLYAAESTLTTTGAAADHRLPLRSEQVEALARALAAQVGVGGPSGGASLPEGIPTEWLNQAAGDLLGHRGTGLVVAGDGQPAAVHALAHAMNAALGNSGTTVTYTDPVLVTTSAPNPAAHLRALVDDLAAGGVTTLLILGGNPAYDAPADLPFAENVARAAFSAHLSLYADETSALCQWHVPEAHFLEAWGDVRAFDGTVTIIQPLIAPLYGGRAAQEVLALLSGQGAASAYDVVRAYWQGQRPGGDFEAWWRAALNAGVVPGTALPERTVTVTLDAGTLPPLAPPGAGLEAVFRPDPGVYDGRFANNAWLQELPRPLTTLTWDNAALVGPATAERLGVKNEDVVVLTLAGRSVEAPVWVLPGHAADSVTLPLGFGRTRAGQAGEGAGFNSYVLRTAGAAWFAPGLEVRPTGRSYPLAATQLHHRMEGRDLVRTGTFAQFQADPNVLQPHRLETGPALETESLYPEVPYEGYRWGMAIDLTACVGCSACMVACQAENNIPVVGKDEVRRQREMHWLRVDSYFEGDADNPATTFQPVPCMHCETAPCEVVCPTNATVHSEDGLNDMVYNRCVGTRFCSHNCPYKVRRFNFLQYADYDTAAFDLLHNPDVTVRTRGVMEKCTYCVQRIRAATSQAALEGRRVRDGEMVTACQAVCPAEAIIFGDLNDPASRVAQMKASPLNYALLGELNTQPRTTYLAVIRNRGG
jgi:molybdopterin-containing oxidoreductase family iron-sulfur binding subunit